MIKNLLNHYYFFKKPFFWIAFFYGVTLLVLTLRLVLD